MFKASFKRRKTRFKLLPEQVAVKNGGGYMLVLHTMRKGGVNRLSRQRKERCSNLHEAGATEMPDCLRLAALGVSAGSAAEGAHQGASSKDALPAAEVADAPKWAGTTLEGWQGDSTKFKFWREPTATVQLQMTSDSTAANPCSLGWPGGGGPRKQTDT